MDNEKIEQILVQLAIITNDITYIKQSIAKCETYENRITNLETFKGLSTKFFAGLWGIVGTAITAVIIRWIV